MGGENKILEKSLRKTFLIFFFLKKKQYYIHQNSSWDTPKEENIVFLQKKRKLKNVFLKFIPLPSEFKRPCG